MRWEVEFSDGHVEVVEAPDTTIAELTAVSNHRGFSLVVQTRPHEEMVDLDAVPKRVIDYIQRTYDASGMGDDELGHVYDDGFTRGMEFMVLQLGLPIRIRH